MERPSKRHKASNVDGEVAGDSSVSAAQSVFDLADLPEQISADQIKQILDEADQVGWHVVVWQKGFSSACGDMAGLELGLFNGGLLLTVEFAWWSFRLSR